MDTSAQPLTSPKTQGDPTGIPAVPTSSISTKEIESGGMELTGEGVREIGTVEVPLPKEVAATGVTVHPTTIALPTPVTAMGVKPAGPTQPMGTGATIVLPLTDEAISQGLSQHMSDSWRWLSEWCVRRLKQMHLAIKLIGKKSVRIQE